tara:strand:+ start:216 stop:581 length:366 start_codon:yes stop_codon:yes gene_type:complete
MPIENKNKRIKLIELADLEKQQFDIEQSIIDTLKEDFEKQYKYQNFLDFLKSKDDDYFKRIKLRDGGKIISLSEYRKSKEPKIKKINLSSLFDHARTIASLTEAEREMVNDLLRRSLGKDK